jgi:hypothetical protein
MTPHEKETWLSLAKETLVKEKSLVSYVFSFSYHNEKDRRPFLFVKECFHNHVLIQISSKMIVVLNQVLLLCYRR